MDRLVLSDAAWERMAPLIIGRPDQKGSTGRDNRMFVEGVLWIVRTGSPWRDLPEAFGDWNSVFRRFSRWSIKGVWWRIFEAMSDDPDFEYLIVDSTIVRPISTPPGLKKGAGRDCGATAPGAVPSRSVPRTIRRSAISTTCIRNFLEIEPNHMQTATVVQGEINGSELWSAATHQRELSRFPLAATNLGILHGRHDRRGRSFAPLVISSPLAWSAAARGRRRDR